MGNPLLKLPEEQIKECTEHIAVICLSCEFKRLQQELERIYREAKMDNVSIAAFSDALLAFLAQNEG
ncbi:MAG: hypothetical protein H0Z39_06445 [Peptococcaceae bacterium]|nr:hypothetical protein [Peptococcaceae bacterium]